MAAIIAFKPELASHGGPVEVERTSKDSDQFSSVALKNFERAGPLGLDGTTRALSGRVYFWSFILSSAQHYSINHSIIVP